MTIASSPIFSMNTLLPFQILQATITKFYHLFHNLPISECYLPLLNLS